MDYLSVMCGGGDVRIEWDPADPQSCADAREQIAALADKGYAFFVKTGEVADAVTAGQGQLEVRKLTGEEYVQATGARAQELTQEGTLAEQAAEGEQALGEIARKTRRGRERGVAVPPMRGG